MIKIISFVDSFKHYDEPIKEFQKRLGKQVDFIKLKPSKRKEINEIIDEESKDLTKILEKEKGYKVLLYIDCRQLSTMEFFELIEQKQMQYSNIIFIIGGAYGVDYDIIQNNIDQKISLSPMTFPHAQAIMMLFEQIYRVSCIKKGINYHH
ncbi:MAG: 23S rRNA (pseudouridine(1915)-N(3))-methyltransferase RlmH [Candidatus Gracilibacteria bacterium]|nr:23S rRNA (pseudouridine(1915)-N(3))-methyltransferase RlmH [Candidatus Gracilibacteria bacterium]